MIIPLSGPLTDIHNRLHGTSADFVSQPAERVTREVGLLSPAVSRTVPVLAQGPADQSDDAGTEQEEAGGFRDGADGQSNGVDQPRGGKVTQVHSGR